MHSRSLTPILLALAASSAVAQSLLPTRGEVVAAPGDVIATQPGVSIGGSAPIDTAVMDLDGNVLFRGRLAGPNITVLNERGLFYGRSGGDLRMFLQGSDPEPSGTLPGVTINLASSSTGQPTGSGIPGSYRISPMGGLVMFGAALYGPGIVQSGSTLNNSAIYWGPIGALQILAQRGQTAPSGGSTLNSSFSSVSGQASALNALGVAIFKSTLLGGDVNGSVNNEAWLMGTPGNLQFLIRKGDTLLNGNLAIGALGFNCAINEAGQVLHDETLSTTLGTTPATTADDKVLLVTTAGVHDILMREGDPAPGTAGALFGTPTIAQGFTASARAAFHASTTGGDTVAGVNDHAWFEGGVGNLQMIVRRGDAAPGAAVGETFASLASSGSYTDAGGVAFVGFLTGPNVTTANDAGIWAGRAGTLQLIAREGDAAPGIPGGTIGSAGGQGIVNGTGTPVMNERGQILFQVTVVTAAADVRAYYSYDPARGLELQLLEGDTFASRPSLQGVIQISGPLQFPSGDSSVQGFANNGDFVLRPLVPGATISANDGFILKGHLGAMQALPTAIPATGGTQTFQLEGGAANAGRIYLVAGTASGTRPGFPFAGQTIPLNIDWWFDGSLAAANTGFYTNTFGFLDPQGRATASLNFPNFPSLAGLGLHHAFIVVDPSAGLIMVSEPTSLLVY